jgi:predicted DNA-binding transcriptional regulator YafY
VTATAHPGLCVRVSEAARMLDISERSAYRMIETEDEPGSLP